MTTSNEQISSGITGLNNVLRGGFMQKSTTLIRGGPGVGKTTFGLHFLMEGVKNGEKSLFITLGETEENIRKNSTRLGLDISRLDILDLSPDSSFFTNVESYDIFAPSEVEMEPTTNKIIKKIENDKPKRVFLDAITQFKYLSSDEYQYRKQALSFLTYLKEKGITVLFTTEHSKLAPDDDMQFICDCIINLNKVHDSFRLTVPKSRGFEPVAGEHTYKFASEGIKVYPNTIPPIKLERVARHQLSFGVKEIDKLLNGGIESSTINLISGPSGVGKTTLGIQLAHQTAKDGYNSFIFSFEEETEMILSRSDGINIPARQHEKEGNMNLMRIEPLLYSFDEFAHLANYYVEKSEASVVIIDSITGFNLALKDKDAGNQLYALSKYLQKNGITMVLIDEVKSITGEFQISGNHISYLSDNIIFLRYLEMEGRMKKAIGVLKKRVSNFEKTLREFEITQNGIQVGEPLDNLRGIFTGNPSWVNKNKKR